MKTKLKQIVIIGGAEGTTAVARALKATGAYISIIQTPADDGGSGGAMRAAFDMMAPGDTRRALIALSELKDKAFLHLFAYRYPTGPLKGEVVGNLILAGLTLQTNNFEKTIEVTKKILKVKGDVIPASLQVPTLYAKLENGKIIRGETNLYIPRYNPRLHIEQVWFLPSVPLNQKAKKTILAADLIILGPGSLYSSIIPNLLVTGMPAALKKTKATVIYIVNPINQPGQTMDFSAQDYVDIVTRYAGAGTIDIALTPTMIQPKNPKKLYTPENLRKALKQFLG